MAKKQKSDYYIYSTLAAPMDYTVYDAGGADIPVVSGAIRIEGGANIPDKYMRTPEGAVVTGVTSAQLEALKTIPLFQLHEKNGYIKVSDKDVDTEVAASDMEGRDKSAPLVDADFKEEEQPKTNEVKSNSRKA